MKKKTLITSIAISIILIVGPTFYFTLIKPKTSSAAWYATSGWYYRRALTINYTSVSGGTDFANFPILVNLTDTSLKTNAQSTGNDILFTSSDGTTKLDHEIEKYTSSTGTLVAWVEIPTLSASANTIIYMYYGNRGASDQSNKTGVWDANYLAVYHLSETSGQHLDSKNSNTSTSIVSLVQQGTATGMAGGADEFNGSSSLVNLPAIGIGGSDATLEVWAKSDVTTATQRAVGRFWTQQSLGYSSDSGGYWGFAMNPATSTTTTTPAFDTNWHYLAGTYDGSGTGASKIYVDGIHGTQVGGDGTGDITNEDRVWQIGAHGNSDQYWDGIIDEIRLSTTVRTAGWITTTYNTINSPSTFFTKGAEERSKDPVAYWSFDSGYGTVAQDSSSNRNNGTLGTGTSAPTWQTEDMCVSGKCLYFGGNDFISVGSTAKDVQSISFWVKPTTTSQNFLDLDGGTHYISDTSGVVSATGFSSPTIYVNGRSNGTLSANNWNHIEVTTATSFNATLIKLGQRSTNFLTGFMDEVKLFNYARSAAEVKTDYNAGKGHAGTSKGSSANLGNNKDNSEAFSEGLVGYWKMDENTGTTLSDSAGIGNTASLGAGASAPTWTAGMFGIGLSFNGSSSYAYIKDSSSLDLTGDLTISMWIKPNSSQVNYADILSKHSNGGYVLEQNSTNTNQFGFGWDTTGSGNWSGTNSTTTTLTANVWQHFVIAKSGATVTHYLNGVQSATATGTSATISTNNLDITIARWSSTGGRHFKGYLDDIRIYNRALSPAEVRQLYNWAPGPVGWWKMDENTGTSANDSSGNGNNGTLSGTTSWGIGKLGSAVNFKTTTNPLVDITDTNLAITSNALTIEAWIYPRTRGEGTYGRIFSSFSVSNCYHFGVDDTNTFSFTPDCGTTYYIANNNSITFNSWQHIAITYDYAARKYTFYKNGVSIGSGSATLTIPATTSSAIGNDPDLGVYGRGFDGFIDDAKIYNYARSQKQIVEDMNAGHPAGGGPVGSQVAHYEFNEGYGTSTHDTGFSTSPNNITLGTGASAPSWSNEGKYGKALSFDGSGDYAATANTAIMAGAGQTYPSLAVSAWVYPQTSAASKTIVHKNSEFRMTTDSNSKVNCSVYAAGAWQTAAVSSSVLSLNSWFSILCSYDGSNIKVWVNGINTGSASQTNSLTSSSSTALYVARDSTTATGTFQGLIDEVKIYNYSLSQDEILVDYNRGSAMVLGSLSTGSSNPAASTAGSQEYCVPGDSSSTSCYPPVGRWDLNEGVGTSAFDTSGYNKTNSYFTGNISWVAGKYGKALWFDGVNDVIRFTEASQFDFGATTDSYTISAWINTTLQSAASQEVVCKNTAATFPFELYLASGQAKFTFRDGTNTVTVSGSTGLNNGKWHYLVGVRDTTADKALIYVDGLLISSITDTTTNPLANNADLSFGNGDSGSYDAADFAGKIDQVMIYNYARTPAQIAWDYNQGAPTTWYKFDECQGSTTYDSMGLNNGTLSIGTTGTQQAIGSCSVGTGSTAAWGNGSIGKYNSSLNFDGTDDYVATGNIALMAGVGASYPSASWGAWVYPTTSAASKTIINKNNEFQLTTDANSKANCAISINTAWQTAAVSSSALPLSTWSHITCTYDGTNILVYTNSLQTGTQAETRKILSLSTTPLSIARNPAPSGYFEGQIDDVRVYNFPLTSTQTKNIYNQGSAVRFGPSSGSP